MHESHLDQQLKPELYKLAHAHTHMQAWTWNFKLCYNRIISSKFKIQSSLIDKLRGAFPPLLDVKQELQVRDDLIKIESTTSPFCSQPALPSIRIRKCFDKGVRKPAEKSYFNG